MFKSFKIDDPIEDPKYGSIDVTVELTDGHLRWCNFVSIRWLAEKLIENSGNSWWLFSPWATSKFVTKDGIEFNMTNFPQHMILVSDLSEQIIEETLHQLDKHNQLKASTIPLRRQAKNKSSTR
jgi:hypothetical protein